MSDFGATYDEMDSTAEKLDGGKDEIDQLLAQLQGYVDDLVADGFKTEKASGKYQEGYQALTDGLKDASDGVTDMAQSLRDMAQQIKDLDSSLAGGA